MGRIPFFILFLSAFSGCQGVPPLNFTGATRVPPPPTGAVGDQGYGGSGYYEPVPRPQVGQGASNWPVENWPAENRQRFAEVPDSQDAFGAAPSTTIPPSQANLNSGNPSASWVDPLAPSGDFTPDRLPAGLSPSNGPGVPLVATPPRIRGFHQSPQRRAVSVPQELAQLQNPAFGSSTAVRQASGYSNWQPRYDDIRR